MCAACLDLTIKNWWWRWSQAEWRTVEKDRGARECVVGLQSGLHSKQTSAMSNVHVAIQHSKQTSASFARSDQTSTTCVHRFIAIGYRWHLEHQPTNIQMTYRWQHQNLRGSHDSMQTSMRIFHPWLRGCPHITSANFRGFQTPPPPLVSNRQQLPYPPSPPRQQSSAFAWPPLPPSSAFVSIWPTPPLSLYSRKTHFLIWNINGILVV